MSTTARLAPNEQATQFAETLLGGGLPGEHSAHIWTPAPRRTYWVQNVAEFIRAVAGTAERDAYFGVGIAGQKAGPFERVRISTATGLLAIPFDIDTADDVHKEQSLPPDKDRARALLAEVGVPPTLVVDSGHGIQGFLALKEPWIFADAKDKQRAVKLIGQFQTCLQLKGSAHGWSLDNVGDLARVMRVPGTHNAKNRRAIVPVRLLECNPDARYTVDELERFVADVPFREASARRDRRGEWGPVEDSQRFHETTPCPVCDGYEEMDHGVAERCWGFISRDRRWALCVRAELAKDMKGHPTSIGVVYKHRLNGGCQCGKIHRIVDGPMPGRELWAADLYVGLYSERLRYVSNSGRWYEFNGKWWEPNEDEVAGRLAQEAVQTLYQQAADAPAGGQKRTFAELGVKMDTAAKMSAMVSAARKLYPIAARPDLFDQDDHAMVFANGVVDMRTGLLLPHAADQMYSRHAGPTLDSIIYDPQAQCPNWLAFLAKVFPNDDRYQDSQEMIAYMARAGGYTCTGDVSEECLFILTGDGENGKTTFTRALADVLGTYYDEMYTETLLSSSQEQHPTGVAGLAGVRGAFASEIDENRRLAESRVKKMVGMEPIRARFMGKDFFTFNPKFKLWLRTNYKPKIRGRDRGIWRRIRVIPFRYTFAPEEKDKHFYEKYLLPELPGIAAWVVRGCLEWQRIGLAEPQRVKDAWADYKHDNDTVAQFIDERVHEHDDGLLKSQTLYASYVEFCKTLEETPVSQKALTAAVTKQFHIETEQHHVPGTRSGTARGWLGLALEGEEPWYLA